MLLLLFLSVLAVVCNAQTNLLHNADFESGITGWSCPGFTCQIVDTAHTGSHAIKAFSRSHYYQGPRQSIQGLHQNTHYTAEAAVKLLTDHQGLGQKINIELAYTFPDKSVTYANTGDRNGFLLKDGWITIRGEFITPNKPFTDVSLYLQGPVPGQEFLVDSTSVKPTPKLTGSNSNLLQNGDFEFGTSGWNCWNFNCALIDDAYTGKTALKATGRKNYYEGPTQILTNLQLKSSYYVEAYAKMLTDLPADVVGQNIVIEISFTFPDNTHSYVGAASGLLALHKDGYIKIQGDFATPDRQYKQALLYFQGPVGGQEFAVDSVVLRPLPTNTHWRSESDNVINSKRKSNIQVSVDTGNLDANKLQIQVNQVKKSFPFGTAIACQEYLNGDSRYQNFINQHFNWAVTENCLKWTQMERQKGVIRNATAIGALKKLKQNGIKIRAHNMVWSVPKNVQSWLKSISNDDLKKEVAHRLQSVMDQTKNYVDHWDVNNENLHGQYYQRKLQDRDYNLEIFRMANKAGPGVKLFLNDYGVVASGGYTGSYLQQAIKFKKSFTGVYGIGVQCHFSKIAPNPTLIKAHLDTLAQAGLPIWVTELDLLNDDENVRADMYETALRALYGHPAVEGIMFWGFWSNHHWGKEPASMVSGNEFRLNAAGKRVLDLLEKQWMTNETHNVGKGSSFTVHGFHGDYEVKVIYDGTERQDLKQTFSLGKNGHDVNINVH